MRCSLTLAAPIGCIQGMKERLESQLLLILYTCVHNFIKITEMWNKNVAIILLLFNNIDCLIIINLKKVFPLKFFEKLTPKHCCAADDNMDLKSLF